MKKIGLPDNIAAETAQEIKKTENYLAGLKKLLDSLNTTVGSTETLSKPRKYSRKGKAASKAQNGRRKAVKSLSGELKSGGTLGIV